MIEASESAGNLAATEDSSSTHASSGHSNLGQCAEEVFGFLIP